MTYLVRFGGVEHLKPGMFDGEKYSIPFTVVPSDFIESPEEQNETRSQRLVVSASRTLLAVWAMNPADLPRVMFEYGRRFLVNGIETGSLPHEPTVKMPMMTTATHPGECPFEPSRIPDPHGLEQEVTTQIGFAAPSH